MDSIRTCSVDGCGRTDRITKGFCNTHYARFRRHGDAGGAAIKIRAYEGATCSVGECQSAASSNGMCRAHYRRVRNHGSTERYGTPQSLADYVAARSQAGERPGNRPGLGPCIVWIGTVGVNGYGYVRLRGSSETLAHRAAYQLAYGDIPHGKVIDHLCRNRVCVNPAHLEAVSNEENLRRGLGYRLRNGMDAACIHGHAYTPENTYTNPNNDADIRCRQCSRERKQSRKRVA